MTAQIIKFAAPSRAAPAVKPTLSPRQRRRIRAIAAEWGVDQETAIVVIVTAYLEKETVANGRPNQE